MKSIIHALLLILIFPCLAEASDPIVIADFTTATNPGTWQSRNIRDLTVEKGALRGVAKTNDPILRLPIAEPIDTAKFKRLLIILQRGQKNPSIIRMFWKTDASSTYEGNTEVKDISTMTGLIEVEFDLSNNEGWTGMLEEIRIDPPATIGQRFAIESIELLP